jgi:hypothetical protein
VGAAAGKFDAIVFMIGLLAGVVVFAAIYPEIYDFAWSGGMGNQTLPRLLGFSTWTVAAGVVVMAIVLFGLGGVAEKKFGRKETKL